MLDAIDGVSHAQLLQEVQTLRETMETLKSALGTRYRVTLRPVQTEPFLGQPVTFIATVTDGLGTTPKGGVPLTFVATWGNLNVADIYSVQKGNTVTTRTYVDGTARVTLLPPTTEEVWDNQQQALESMLSLLGTSAATPQKTADGLQSMARLYRWNTDLPFNQAVDIYFRDFRSGALDTINYHDYMQEWSYFDSTITVYAQEDQQEAGTAVQGITALNLRFKDWLGPWLQTYMTVSTSESNLDNDLQNAKRLGPETGTLVDSIYRHINNFFNNQYGLVGEYTGRKIAETSIHQFLNSGINDLSPDVRASLFSPLKAASSTITTSGSKTFTALGQVRTDLQHQVNTRVQQIDVVGIGGLKNRLGTLESQVALKVDTATFNTALTSKVDTVAFNEALTSKVDTATFNNALASKVDTGAFNEALAQKIDSKIFNDALATKVDTTTFNGTVANLVTKDSLTKILAGKVDTATFTGALANKVDVATFDNVLATKVDTAAFNNALASKIGTATFNGALANLVNTTTFNNTVANLVTTNTLNQALTGKVDTTTFNNALATKVDATTFNNALSSKVDVSTFNKALDGKVDLKRFNETTATLTSTLDNKVDTVTFTNALANKVDATTFNNVLAQKVDTATFRSNMSALSTHLNVPQDVLHIEPNQ